MKKITILVIIANLVFSCTTPYNLQSSNYEEALVIEATLTNELKKQEIKISKTYRLEENGPEFVENANIYVQDNFGNIYDFVENNEKYESVNPFQCIDGREYQLFITTSDGKNYQSDIEKLTTESPIQNIEVSDKIVLGERGAEIKVKSFDPTNSSKYYRFKFEETYKIIAPKWVPFTVTVDPITKELINTPRTYEARTCYSTEISKDILLYNTSNLTEDRVDYMVRFISVKNPIIKHRYSILVRQYVLNLKAYTFYNTLKTISNSTSILSQVQPGFFNGNIKCTSNPNEKVIGYFDVSTVSTQRIFFNFEEIFPNTLSPGYFFDCFDNCVSPNPVHCPGVYKFCFNNDDPECGGEFVNQALNNGSMLLYEFYDPIIYLVEPPCGDCTKFSSNIVPSFWQ